MFTKLSQSHRKCSFFPLYPQFSDCLSDHIVNQLFPLTGSAIAVLCLAFAGVCLRGQAAHMPDCPAPVTALLPVERSVRSHHSLLGTFQAFPKSFCVTRKPFQCLPGFTSPFLVSLPALLPFPDSLLFLNHVGPAPQACPVYSLHSFWNAPFFQPFKVAISKRTSMNRLPGAAAFLTNPVSLTLLPSTLVLPGCCASVCTL